MIQRGSSVNHPGSFVFPSFTKRQQHMPQCQNRRMEYHAGTRVTHGLPYRFTLFGRITMGRTEIAKCLFCHVRTMQHPRLGIIDQFLTRRTKHRVFFSHMLLPTAINADHLLHHGNFVLSFFLNVFVIVSHNFAGNYSAIMTRAVMSSFSFSSGSVAMPPNGICAMSW